VRFGDWCVCDEADLANPGTATALNAILDNRPLVIPDNGGEVVPIHERFRLFFTGNTGGGGDRSGLYQGTRIQNVALRNRCMFTLVTYPEPDEEMAILDKVTPELPGFAKEKMIAVANDVRRLFMGAEEISEDDYRGDAAPHADPDSGDQPDALEVTISTRTLVLWAEATWLSCGVAKYEFQPHKYALDRVLLMGAEPETRRKVFEVVQRHFGNVPIQGGLSA
jgi:cobaltochelatase CobS